MFAHKTVQFLYRILSFIIYKIKGLTLVYIDNLRFDYDRIFVNGWALSDVGIDEISVYLDNILIGKANYGISRPDVEAQFKFVNNSLYSGFRFDSKININEFNAENKHLLVLIAISKSGQRRIIKFDSIKLGYQNWIDKHEPKKQALEIQKRTKLNIMPTFHIIIFENKCKIEYFQKVIQSIENQTYKKWNIYLFCNSEEIHQESKIICDRLENMKVYYQLETEDISEILLNIQNEDWLIYLDSEISLLPFALFEFTLSINKIVSAELIYSDEDYFKVNTDIRINPYFKPDWNSDLFNSFNYIGQTFIFKQELYLKIKHIFISSSNWSAYNFLLLLTEKAKNIHHLPKILVNCRIENSVENTSKEKIQQNRNALNSHLNRMEKSLVIENGLLPYSFNVKYGFDEKEKVSIIIPNRDNADVLFRCINSIEKKSSFMNYEIIIIENGSVEKSTYDYYELLKRKSNINIIQWDKPFNYSGINNIGANIAGGNILLFLNNDTEVINSDWLESMITHAQRKEIGAVGAKLLYPDNKIQHAGVIIGIGGLAAGHSHRYAEANDDGYFGRLKAVQNISAVTGACLMVRKDVFYKAGGFDEEYAIALNDVDLCLKIRELAYMNVWTPYALLYHYEYNTRGANETQEKKQIWSKEVKLFRHKWSRLLAEGDPYYNINLSLENEDFTYYNC